MFFFKMENGVISGPGFELRDRGTTALWSHNVPTVYQALGREPTPNLKMSPQLMLLIPIGRKFYILFPSHSSGKKHHGQRNKWSTESDISVS